MCTLLMQLSRVVRSRANIYRSRDATLWRGGVTWGFRDPLPVSQIDLPMVFVSVFFVTVPLFRRIHDYFHKIRHNEHVYSS